MHSIFVIDKNTKCNLGIIDFIPHKGDRIAMKASVWRERWKSKLNVYCMIH